MATEPVTPKGQRLRLDPVTGVLQERRYALEILSGANGNRVMPLDQRVVLGSSPECSLQLENSTVSRHHVELTPTREGVRVRDLGSTNGTYVAGARVNDAVFEDEATLTLGNVRIRLRAEEKEVPTSSSEDHFGEALGKSLAMRKLFGILAKVAAAETTAVLVGETGTGKDLLARSLWQASPRAQGPFVVVDCASISTELAESELFGHMRGSFTGASQERDGAFLRAHKGTLFLDGIAELPFDLQTRLLRALAEGTVRRVGEDVGHTVDVRIIASTHKDLAKEVAAGNFRRDLYYRLAVAVISIPPLRERPEDIPLLAQHFWSQRGDESLLPQSFVELLLQHPWPGNGRELRNVMDRAGAMYPTADRLEEVTEHDFKTELIQRVLSQAKDATERDRILEALQQCAGNQTQAAKLLGISRGTLLSRLDSYGTPRPRKASRSS